MSSLALGVCVTLVLSSFLIQQQGEGAVNSCSATAQPALCTALMAPVRLQQGAILNLKQVRGEVSAAHSSFYLSCGLLSAGSDGRTLNLWLHPSYVHGNECCAGCTLWQQGR